MNTNHLTDETLQAFLLNEWQDDAIATHLKVCPTCQIRLEEYKFLTNSLQKLKTENFSFDVTSLVMEKINELETRKEKNANTVLFISLCIASMPALVLLYPYIKIIFIQFKLFSIMTNAFIMVSVLGVAIFLLNDIFRKYKQKEKLLLQ